MFFYMLLSHIFRLKQQPCKMNPLLAAQVQATNAVVAGYSRKYIESELDGVYMSGLERIMIE